MLRESKKLFKFTFLSPDAASDFYDYAINHYSAGLAQFPQQNGVQDPHRVWVTGKGSINFDGILEMELKKKFQKLNYAVYDFHSAEKANDFLEFIRSNFPNITCDYTVEGIQKPDGEFWLQKNPRKVAVLGSMDLYTQDKLVNAINNYVGK